MKFSHYPSKMKKHSIIPYFLLGFLTVVILLIGHGVGIALSFSFQTNEFNQFRESLNIPNFISGADLLISATFFMLFFILLGISKLITSINHDSIQKIILTILTLLLLLIWTITPYLYYVDIRSSYMYLSVIFYLIALRINLDFFQCKISFESSIDLIFYNFIQALYGSLFLIIILFILNFVNPFSYETIKLFILTYIFSFFLSTSRDITILLSY